MKNKTTSVFVCACIAVALIIACSNPLFLFGAEDGAPTMYVNDEPWYNESQYNKWYNITLINYIPISMLEKIGGIEIKENKYLHNVMISYGKDKFMTFDIDTSTVYTAKGEQYSVSTYLIYGKRYIPAQLVCDNLGLSFEITKNQKAVRISDKMAQKNFNELLLIYNPSLTETRKNETTSAITTASQTTEPPMTQEEIGDRTIYFTFSGCPNEYTSEILDILARYGYKALFLLDDGIREYDAVARRIAVAGHTISINLTDVKENPAGKAKQINNLLYNIIKYKTRITSSDGNINNDGYSSLISAGYIVLDYNSGMSDDKKASARYLFNEAQQYIRGSEKVIFRFHSTKYTVAALPQILDYISGMPQFTIKTLNETS